MFVRQVDVTPEVHQGPPSTNIVEVVTSQVASNALTGEVVTNQFRIPKVLVTPGLTWTNYITNEVFAVNPRLVSVLQTGQTVSSFVPLPFADVLGGLCGLALAGLGFVARQKTQKAALVPALIAGVEEAKNPDVKASIKRVALGLGLEKRLNDEVKKIT